MITISYNRNEDDTSTLKIEITKDTTSLETFISYASQELYIPKMIEDENGFPVPIFWETLSNLEKLNVLKDAIRYFLVTAAQNRRKLILTNEAVDVAIADPDTQI